MCIGKPIIKLISGESKIIEDAECGFAFSANNKKDFIKNTIY